MDLFDELYVLCILVSECYCGLGTSGFTIKVILRILVIWCNTLKFPIEFECSHLTRMYDLASIDMYACMNAPN